MRLIHVQKRNGLERKGFTLIELLVVITIIGILMALTLGVISKVYAYLDETKVVAEVNRLAQGCEQFKSTFGRYPPARIILCDVGANYQALITGGGVTGALAAYSAEYLSSIFPGINLSSGTFDWDGNPATSGSWVLEGEECLVFFLGGILPKSVTGNGAPIGFNTDKTQPTLITTGARLGPFFEFDAARLATSPNATLSGGNFPVYKDVYGTAYAYFLARTPGMSNYFHPGAPQMAGFTLADQQALSDCYLLTGNYVPLWKQSLPAGTPTTVSYHKGDSYQIVSAGKDKQFGCGGLWNQVDPEQSVFDFMRSTPTPFAPYAGTATPDQKQATYDNITNVTNGRVVAK